MHWYLYCVLSRYVSVRTRSVYSCTCVCGYVLGVVCVCVCTCYSTSHIVITCLRVLGTSLEMAASMQETTSAK